MLNTKQDFSELLFKLVNPLRTKFSPHCALINVGTHATWYEVRSAQTEAFARPLWGLVPYWAGGGKDFHYSSIYKNGIAYGSDPESEEYWGDCHDRDQRFVEMASMAYGIIFAPDKMWDCLDDKTKDNFAAWLYSINENAVCDSNWLFFRILVNVALKKIGRKYSEEILEKDLNRVNEFYINDGWYSDGMGGQKDYYIAFAIHFYSLIYVMAMENEDKERCQRFKSRAEEFAKTFIYWFDENGDAVPYGRSLTYRFAQASFWSACVAAGIRPFSLGVMKGIIARHLEQWFKDDNIFDNGGILTVGYKYNQLVMSENYNAPGSPYWGMKVFAILMLDDDHEFWKTEAEPLPALAPLKKINAADMLVQRKDGSAVIYPGGTIKDFACGQMRAKYLKFAYSSEFGFSVPKSNNLLFEAAPDSELCFIIDDLVFTRKKNCGFTLYDDRLVTKWSPFMGIEVETTIIPTETGHKRIHRISSEYDCTAYDSGFAVSSMDCDECKAEIGSGYVRVANKHNACTVKSQTGKCEYLDPAPNTNLLTPKTQLPTVKYEIKKGETEIITEILTEKF